MDVATISESLSSNNNGRLQVEKADLRRSSRSQVVLVVSNSMAAAIVDGNVPLSCVLLTIDLITNSDHISN